jgi:hypothetical protein
MTQATATVFGVPDAIERGGAKVRVSFGGMRIEVSPDISDAPTPMKIEAVYENGAWRAVRTVQISSAGIQGARASTATRPGTPATTSDRGNGATVSTTAPAPSSAGHARPVPPQAHGVTQSSDEPRTSSFAALARNRPMRPASSRSAADANPQTAGHAPATPTHQRPRFDLHADDGLDDDIPF